MSLVVDDTVTGERLFEVRLAERFRGGVGGACDVVYSGYRFFLTRDRFAFLRPSNCIRAIDEDSPTIRYRLHSWQRDGTEVTPLDGVPVEEPVYLVPYLPEVDSLDTNDDGELFYGTDRTAIDGSGPVALRIVRRAPDMTLAMVSDPITDPVAHVPERDGSRSGYGFWGAATADGAYVAHVVAPAEPGGVPHSHFVRVERDGSIGFHHTTLALAARDYQGLDRMVAEHDGGIVALVSDRSLPADLSFFAVRRDGSLVHGPRG
jgi:hypothetical protein